MPAPLSFARFVRGGGAGPPMSQAKEAASALASSHDPTLVRLQEQGAGLLPDPEAVLRKKAAALAADETERAAEAFRTAGCVPIYKDEDEEES